MYRNFDKKLQYIQNKEQGDVYLLGEMGDPGQCLVEGGRVQGGDEGEGRVWGEDPGGEGQAVVVLLQPHEELIEGGLVTVLGQELSAGQREKKQAGEKIILFARRKRTVKFDKK